MSKEPGRVPNVSFVQRDRDIIDELLQVLCGQRTQQIASNIGSWVVLDFETSAAHRLKLMFLNCAWRIETDQGPLIGCEDPREVLVPSVKQLEKSTFSQ